MYRSCDHSYIHTYKVEACEPDGNEAGEARGRRISRMMSNNLVVKFFSGTKSIERMTFIMLA